MKFKLDENLPELVREALNELGHDAHTAADEQLSGASDQTLLQACRTEGRILITLDLDFSDIRAYPPGTYPGIWVLRPPKQTFKAIEALVRAGIRLTAVERVRGQLRVLMRSESASGTATSSALTGAMAASRQWDSFRAGLPGRVCWLKRGVANSDGLRLNHCQR